MKPAVFLDRDGVLNEVVERDGEPGSPRRLAEFQPVGDLQAVSRLKAAGLDVFVVTNQPDVGRGHITYDQLDAMLGRLRAEVPIDDVRVCPHEDRHGCECRKPRPGMLLDLARCWHVDLSRSWMIGDTWRDVDAAKAAGCRSILLRRPYNAGVAADEYAETLSEAVELVVGR